MAICLDTGSTPVISIIGVSGAFISAQNVDIKGIFLFLETLKNVLILKTATKLRQTLRTSLQHGAVCLGGFLFLLFTMFATKSPFRVSAM